MSERFFSSQPINSDHVTLDGPEAHHLLHVMRATAGEQVTLFDDSGTEFAAVVEKLGRSQVDLRVIEGRPVDRELPFPLTLGVALPKGDRQKWLIEKLTELGVTTLVPLTTDRGVAQPTEGALERLHRAVIEAAKQCGRNRLMRIAPPQSWEEWVCRSTTAGDGSSPNQATPPCRRLIAHTRGAALSQLGLTASPTQLAIGPEGGLTESEVRAALHAGWQAVNLGPRILRVETAAIALAAAITLR